jgi:hypothetical protein
MLWVALLFAVFPALRKTIEHQGDLNGPAYRLQHLVFLSGAAEVELRP